jgi:hypothetical protein
LLSLQQTVRTGKAQQESWTRICCGLRELKQADWDSAAAILVGWFQVKIATGWVEVVI